MCASSSASFMEWAFRGGGIRGHDDRARSSRRRLGRAGGRRVAEPRVVAAHGRLQGMAATGGELRFGTPAARWVIAATVLGSGIAFLDGTIVNVALPAIGRDLETDVAGLQWTLDAYLVTLTAFLLFGGALGDRFGRRRIFLAGLVSFTLARVACTLAPDATVLAITRAFQGAAGALLVPGSLAIIGSAFHDVDRGARSARGPGSPAWRARSVRSSAVG